MVTYTINVFSLGQWVALCLLGLASFAARPGNSALRNFFALVVLMSVSAYLFMFGSGDMQVIAAGMFLYNLAWFFPTLRMNQTVLGISFVIVHILDILVFVGGFIAFFYKAGYLQDWTTSNMVAAGVILFIVFCGLMLMFRPRGQSKSASGQFQYYHVVEETTTYRQRR